MGGLFGGLLALLSAATFAFNNASLRRGVLTGSVAQALAITIPIGFPIFLGVALLTGQINAVFQFPTKAVLLLLSAGVIHFVWGRYCNYRATRAIGANLVAPVQQMSLIVTLLLALTVLGEVLTPLRLLGIFLVLIGPTVSGRGEALKNNGKKGDARQPIDPAKAQAFEPKYAEGYLFALLSTTGYGVSPILVRLALEHKGFGSSIAAGLLAYTAATVAMGVILLWPGLWREVRNTERVAVKWFTISGVFVCMSQMFLYMAVSLAPLTIVTPINRLSLVFRLYFGKLLNPEHEMFGGRIILGTIVCLAGAAVLSLSTESVVDALPLPAWIEPVLHWHWP